MQPGHFSLELFVDQPVPLQSAERFERRRNDEDAKERATAACSVKRMRTKGYECGTVSNPQPSDATASQLTTGVLNNQSGRRERGQLLLDERISHLRCHTSCS